MNQNNLILGLATEITGLKIELKRMKLLFLNQINKIIDGTINKIRFIINNVFNLILINFINN